jgi:undecaprenyl-phosphate 4-deoxy-4-formamido-L-arabinose transferase
MELSVIIPVYNGEKTLQELNRRIKDELNPEFSYEVIYVYDCGKDQSWEIIKELISSDPQHVRGCHLKRNYGQHNAILFGMTKAQGELIITMDEDLQHDPGYIRNLIKTQRERNYDVVYGKFEKLQHPGMRVRTSEMLRKLLKISVPDIYPDYSPYRLMKKSIADKISALKNSYSFIDGYIGWTTENINCISVKHFKRADGISSYSYFKLIKHAVFIAIAYSKIKTSLLFTSLAFNLLAIGLYIMDQRKNDLINNKFIVLLFSAGVIILLIGLLAEILHYGNLRLNNRPVEIE